MIAERPSAATCLFALQEAVRLKERGHAKEVVAVSIGPQHFTVCALTTILLTSDPKVCAYHAQGL